MKSLSSLLGRLSLALLVPFVPLLGGCVGPQEPREEPARKVESTAGVVIEADPAIVWEDTKRSLSRFKHVFDEATRVATAYIGLGTVTVKVEPRDASGMKTILRVVAQANGVDAPDTADRVASEIQTLVLQRR